MGWFRDVSEESYTCPRVPKEKPSSIAITGRGCSQREDIRILPLSPQFLEKSDTKEEPRKHLPNVDIKLTLSFWASDPNLISNKCVDSR